MLSFRLTPTPPFRLDLTAWVLRRRPNNGWDLWDGETYRRVLVIEGVAVEMSVAQLRDKLVVEISGPRIPSRAKEQAIAALRRLLGIDVGLSAFYRFARSDRRLAQLAERFHGFKPPRFLSVFESLVNGITCQQLSLTVGIILLNRLVEHYGRTLSGGHAFPEPNDLSSLDPEELVLLGYSHNKARSLIELAQAIGDTRFHLASLEDANNNEALASLQQLRGIGRWTAEYVLLRGLGRTNVFPGDDVGARNNLEKWLGLRKPLTYDSAQRVLKRWAPFGGLIYFHLLLDQQEGLGYLNQPPEQKGPADRKLAARGPRIL
ncbi:MAG TPA: AlkA N-terminal domain-containing protein [Bryobacteraceae bacterium]|nr:AlkA N-terminal domain-containing protein [Bryobacteraceae bacterium]